MNWHEDDHMLLGNAWVPVPALLAIFLVLNTAVSHAQQGDFPFTEEEANYLPFWELVTDMELYVQARECAQRGALEPSLSDELSQSIRQKHVAAQNALLARMEAYVESRVLPQFAAASAADIEKGCQSLEETVRQN